MLYRPSVSQMLKVDRINFTPRRWIKLPHQIFLGWIKNDGGLREPTPLPFLLEEELKPGFYWGDLIH